MPLLKLSKFQRHRLSLFFTCLLLAIGAWLFFALSNNYTYQVNTVLEYTKLPRNKSFYPLQHNNVQLQIQGSGWQLLFSKMRIGPKSIKVSLDKLNKTNYVTFESQLRELNQQFSSNQKVLSVQPDTLYFDFLARFTKKVPVKFNFRIKFKGQYGFSDSILIFPKYVNLVGPKDQLDKINYWNTDTLKLNDVDKPIFAKVEAQSPSSPNISIFPKVIEVTIPVNEFTEKQIEVPINVLNNREFDDVKLLPEKIKITYLVALNNYSKIGEKSFTASVNLSRKKLNNYSQLPVIISKFPEFCKLTKIEPQNIDFIILK